MNFILLAVMVSSSWAYQFTQDFNAGFYWSSLPIEFQVIDSNPSRKQRIETALDQAMNEWQSKILRSIWDFAPGVSSPTKNIVRWSDNFAQETGLDSTNILAVVIRNTSGPYIAKAEVVINGSHTVNSNDYFLLTVLTHELGHTVGLDHSEVSQAIMAPSLQVMYSGIHQDDMNGMNHLLDETHYRQSIGYVSPLLAAQGEMTEGAMSCGTITTAAAATTSQTKPLANALSILSGMLLGLSRRLLYFLSKCFGKPKSRT